MEFPMIISALTSKADIVSLRCAAPHDATRVPR